MPRGISNVGLIIGDTHVRKKEKKRRKEDKINYVKGLLQSLALYPKYLSDKETINHLLLNCMVAN